jgi:glutamate 5-kinase
MKIVIKIGSNIVSGHERGLNTRRISSLASHIADVQDMGHRVVIVSSGAVAAGMRKLGLKSRPGEVKLKQAAAAVGQSSLIWTYEKYFGKRGKKVAQVLLTRDGLSDRKMYINAKNTLATLLDYGIIPIVNENDTVATDEIRFGDNDNLAALVASVVEAEKLIILSDVDGLFSADPARKSDAKLIPSVGTITEKMIRQAGKSNSALGTGGMYSKLLAARKAVRSGITVHIVNGRRPRLLVSLVRGMPHGTEFTAHEDRLPARKGWIAYGIRAKGSLVLDTGAVRAVIEGQKSLLPSGIVAVEGTFKTGDAVACVDGDGHRIAKGLTNYSSDEIRRIMGKRTSQVEQALGYRYSDEVIHRDNMVLTQRASR